MPLLQKLKDIIKAETKKSVERQELEECIFNSFDSFEAPQKFLNQLSRMTVHELSEPLKRVIEILEQEANREWIVGVLGGRETGVRSLRINRRTIARYERLLGDLHKIARWKPPRPAKPRPGRPSKSDALYGPVKLLAHYWERLTGKSFKQYWHKGAPANNATLFIQTVIDFIAPQLLRSLPKMTELIVTERRASSHN